MKPSHILLSERWMIFIQLWIFNVICAVRNRRWTQWFRFTTLNKSSYSNTISIVAVSLTFDFTNADFIIIFLGFLLFRCHKKRINWPCLFCLFRLYFYSGNIYCCDTCLCQKRTTNECRGHTSIYSTIDLHCKLKKS